MKIIVQQIFLLYLTFMTLTFHVISCSPKNNHIVDSNKQDTNTMKKPLQMKTKVDGKGVPLVLVPGGLTGWKSWEPFVDPFVERQKQVIRVQLLNVEYGLDNRDLPTGYSIKTESRALLATLNTLNLKQPLDFISWSSGALVTLDFALDHPERIRSLTLIEPPAFWVLREENSIDSEAQHTLDFIQSMHGDITEEMLASFLQEAGLVPQGQRAQDLPQWKSWVPYRQSLRNNLAILHHQDSMNRLDRLKAPVLFIKGIGSGEYYHRIEELLISQLPHARSIELPGAHAAHIVSRDRFLSEVDQFQKTQK